MVRRLVNMRLLWNCQATTGYEESLALDDFTLQFVEERERVYLMWPSV